jgi:precorrin-3B C17-methyltransferase
MRSNGDSERIAGGEGRDPHPQTKNGQRNGGSGPGRLSIVSLGPGSRNYLAPEALQALTLAQVVVGYRTYVELITDLTEGKRILASGMRKEVQRCQAAIDHALAGYRVALVSSGDAGIYGMAGLVLDICRARNLSVRRANPTAEVQGDDDGATDFLLDVIPGVAAFNAAASLLGAPLMHDFAGISLSDHLTPWEIIEKRLVAVASADFVVALYNPRSKTRPDLLDEARGLLLRYRFPDTPVGIVWRAMRDGQFQIITTLAEIPMEEVDMQSVLIVGNSQTYTWNGWMVTPRGYMEKYSVVVS